MATRSAIGYIQPNGAIRAVYCHWDGYPERQLPILQAKYNTLRKVQALIRPGSMSSLETESTWDADAKRAAQPLYHHERGQGPWCASDGSYAEPPRSSKNLEAAMRYWAQSCCEYMYLYSPKEGWVFYSI